MSREVGVEIYRLEEWKERALAGLEVGLKEQAGDPAAVALDVAKRHIGELSMDNELLRERARAAERRLPLPMRRSRRWHHDLRGHRTPVRDPAGVSGVGALAIDALRSAGAGVAPGAGRAPGPTRSEARSLG